MARQHDYETIRDLKGGSFGCCRYCGTAKHKSGWFYLAGYRSKVDPPCTDYHPAMHDSMKEWRESAEDTWRGKYDGD